MVGLTFHTAVGLEDWHAAFEAACSKTDIAMSLSEDELLTLIQECKRIELEIRKLEETERKVYLRRLQMCQNLYLFVLETKKNEEKK